MMRHLLQIDWGHNPGSRGWLPTRAARLPMLTPDQVGAMIVSGVERRLRSILAPRSFRWLFLLNSLFPAWSEAAKAAPVRGAHRGPSGLKAGVS